MRLSRVASVIRSFLECKLSGVESNHRRRRIRSLCFRYNTGQSGRSESNRLSRASKARRAPFPFIPFSSAQVARMGVEPGTVRRGGWSLRLERAVSCADRRTSRV
jgi:hypothetical protein